MRSRRAPPPVGMDFAGRSRHPGWLGWVMLAFGISAVLAVIHENDVLDARLIDEQHRLARVKRSVDHNGQGRAASLVPVSAREARQAVSVSRALNKDWSALFSALEDAAADPALALLSVDQEAVKGELKVVGEARNLSEVFAFVGRLEEGGVVRDARLASYEFHASGAVQVVGFTLAAHWEAPP